VTRTTPELKFRPTKSAIRSPTSAIRRAPRSALRSFFVGPNFSSGAFGRDANNAGTEVPAYEIRDPFSDTRDPFSDIRDPSCSAIRAPFFLRRPELQFGRIRS
jgi:hypothetical protein